MAKALNNLNRKRKESKKCLNILNKALDGKGKSPSKSQADAQNRLGKLK